MAFRIVAAGAMALLAAVTPVGAQVRGVYPLGMSAVGAGSLFGGGVSYANAFLFYQRDEMRGPAGELVATGKQTVLMDLNTVAWATAKPVILGARFALAATLPIANNSLSSDVLGPQSGGGGFADSFYQPFMLGWTLSRADIKVAYGFLAPTGAFDAGRSDNVGSGYWTHVVSSGQTLWLNASKRIALAAFQMYEVHGEQEGTGVNPGENFDLDWSLTGIVTLSEGLDLQLGPAGYSQWQTSASEGPDLDTSTRYQVHAIGLAANLLLPGRRVNLGTRYLHELEARSTFQGYSFQILGSVNF
ncbi:MAG TPA: transporter [Gemmatimonadales bacterium]|nr:transporter [Gemmatimonadales bacterium]